jgi:site-specific DNA-cytosine methylase
VRLSPSSNVREIRHAHLFCGIGGGAKGFNRAAPRVGNTQARFVCAGGIDVDPGAIRNFDLQTGVKGTVLDLFSREQYIAFHSKEPPAGWREATPADIRRAFGPKRPDVVFLSAPCKGFSGLLSATQSKTDKYQALNGLTVRGVWLLLEAYKDDPIPIVLFENVPRILTRGSWLLDQITALFRASRYSVNLDTHDCGVIGNLAQSRKRALLIARQVDLIPPFIYQPRHHKLRGVGEVIGKLPLPGDPIAGAMHRVPSLQFKTWMRLALVPAGKDWRALNELAVVDGNLRDFGIVPEHPLRNGALGVNAWGQTAGVLTSQRAPGQGYFSVADPRVEADWNADVLGVRNWGDSTGVIAGRSSPSNGVYSVADPRGPIVGDAEGRGRAYGKYPVDSWGGPAKAVIGGRDNGAYAVADPRPGYSSSTHQNILSVANYGRHSKSVTGARHVAGGALSVADPRPPTEANQTYNQYGVNEWGASAGAVSSQSTPGGGAYSVADPRLPGKPRFNNTFRIVPYDGTSPAIAGPGGPAGGLAVADPRPEGKENYTTTKYKVTAYNRSSRAVIGASTTGDGAFAVADPRGPHEANKLHGKYPVSEWGKDTRAVIAGRDNGAFAVADPRPSWGNQRHQNIMRVTPYESATGTIPAGVHSVTGGQPCVADVRREHYQTGGHYGVVAWQQSAYAVSGSACHDNGFNSVADPRIIFSASNEVEEIKLPEPNDRLVCRIIATDGTWHRPFTTLDLGALQALLDPEEIFYQDGDGVWQCRIPFDLVGASDVTKREWIGNMVPGDAATGMAETIGETILLAEQGETFFLSNREIWVKPGALALAVDNDQIAFHMDSEA